MSMYIAGLLFTLNKDFFILWICGNMLNLTASVNLFPSEGCINKNFVLEKVYFQTFVYFQSTLYLKGL